MSARTDPAVAVWIDRLNEVVGRLCGWLTLAMVLVTCAVVVLRYAFDLGFVWMQESVTWLHATVFMLGLGYALRHESHVRVDVFYRGWSRRRRAWVDLLGSVFFLMPTCAYVLFESRAYVATSWAIRETSREAGGLPALYLLKTVILVAAVLLLLQGLATVARAWRELRGG
ncbi:MAG: TRAP transporter small permease subunit [Steroidobacteraceae bacterium]|nr:TRAP transporter small permease subunit [Steroidobacteraceae bacterium]